MNVTEATAFVRENSVVLESARGTVPSIAQAIAGAPIRGSWWGHPKRNDIFLVTRALRENPDVLVCRLVDRKVTYVHRQLWPALIKLADEIGHDRLARIREVHAEGSGQHKVVETPFPDWVDRGTRSLADNMSESAPRRALEVVLPNS
jgi:hypothetical protein